MVNKHKLCDTNLEGQPNKRAMGVAQTQPPNMPPPLSLVDGQPTTQPEKSVGNKGDKDERVQKPSLKVQ